MTYSVIWGFYIAGNYFSSPGAIAAKNPFFYFRLFSYIIGHGSWEHLTGNFAMILLVGPLLEEKYGSGRLFEMIIVTAFITSLLNMILFSSSIIGGSGIAFMMILLASFANTRSGEIPLTFLLIAFLFLGGEVASGLKADNISQFSHVAGGIAGAGYGFVRIKK
jgi:membrane associated rhomboid family serine protease